MSTGISRRIFVIEDDEANRLLLDVLLQQAGYAEVELISDPRTALERAAQVRPGLVFLDLHLPHISGFELMEKLAEIYGGDTPPVVVLSGDVSTQTQKAAYDAGASAFLIKPFDVNEVLRIVDKLLT